MKYQVRVAGRIFEGENPRQLLKRAIEAHRKAVKTKSSAGPGRTLSSPGRLDVSASQAS